jgi:hypothetical protein
VKIRIIKRKTIGIQVYSHMTAIYLCCIYKWRFHKRKPFDESEAISIKEHFKKLLILIKNFMKKKKKKITRIMHHPIELGRSKEEVLHIFLKAWRKKDWINMYHCCQASWRSKNSITALMLMFEEIPISSFKIINEEKNFKDRLFFSGHASRFTVLTKSEENKTNKRTAIMLCTSENNAYKTIPDGIWTVNPISVLKTTKINVNPFK